MIPLGPDLLKPALAMLKTKLLEVTDTEININGTDQDMDLQLTGVLTIGDDKNDSLSFHSYMIKADIRQGKGHVRITKKDCITKPSKVG